VYDRLKVLHRDSRAEVVELRHFGFDGGQEESGRPSPSKLHNPQVAFGFRGDLFFSRNWWIKKIDFFGVMVSKHLAGSMSCGRTIRYSADSSSSMPREPASLVERFQAVGRRVSHHDQDKKRQGDGRG
jgi:hypothetical protein